MESKYLNLIRILIEQHPAPVTASTLSVGLNITTRSIKSYIKDINTSYPDCVYSSRNGYHVNLEEAKNLVHDNRESIPQTSRQRTAYLLKALLQRHDLDKFDVCEELFISISTLQSVIGRVKKELAQYNLHLLTEKDKISIVGSEQNKRKLYSKSLYEECHSNFMDLSAIQSAFPDIDITFIKETLEDVLEGFQFFVNDYSLTNLVLHIAIAVARNQSGNTYQENLPDSTGEISHEKRKAAEKVIIALENKFELQFSEREAHELVLLFVFRVNFISGPEISQNNLSAHISSETLDLVQIMVQSAKDVFGIYLGDEHSFTRFALHISNLLNRSRNHHYNKNPLTETLKTNSPLIYEMAVHVSSIIRQKTGITINDDEIAFITMHIGSALCAQEDLDSKIKTILYCPNYYNMNSQLAKMLEENFSSEIIITNIYTDESQLKEIQNNEFLLTTVPLNQERFVNCVLIHIFLQGKSIADVRYYIEQMKLHKKRDEFEGYLRHIVVPDVFEVNTGLVQKRHVIRHMVNRMVELGYVKPTFEDEVWERESISSTAFHGFAIPHALKMNACKTGMYILINPDEVDWGGRPVQLVLMLCFRPDDRHIFHAIFDSLTMILNDSNSFKRVARCKNYEEFISLVTSLVE